jgi:pullulanase/glycogen debranching enzyme
MLCSDVAAAYADQRAEGEVMALESMPSRQSKRAIRTDAAPISTARVSILPCFPHTQNELFLHGAPMLLAGDEFGRTQKGINNAYTQDTKSPGSIGPCAKAGEELAEFVRQVIDLRHDRPLLRRESFRGGMAIDWWGTRGGKLFDEDWNSAETKTNAARFSREAVEGEGAWRELVMLYNAADEFVDFPLPTDRASAGPLWSTQRSQTARKNRRSPTRRRKSPSHFPRSLMLIA